LLYPSLKVQSRHEILTSTHDHYVTEASLSFLVERTGAKLKRIALYDDSAKANGSQIVDRIAKSLTSRTRVVALTFVHSCSGVKLPIAAIGKLVAERNRGRAERDRILFCVDGVHGFGVEDVTLGGLGCDFLIAGTHKWLHGPRGTGILVGRTAAWDHLRTTIPTFSTFTGKPGGPRLTPGGFPSYEHRWALKEAFELHLALGKAKIQKRIHDLNTHMKEGMGKIPGVVVHTPLSSELSAGIICFSVRNLSAVETVKRLDELGIVATDSPYRISYARVTPGLLNNHPDVEKTLAAIARL
jgi:selenocysteine lyase/cysteine desulfurase